MTKFIYSFILLLLCAACGGGNGGGSSTVSPPVVERHDLLYCFFGDAGNTLQDTQGFTNCAFIMGWGGAVQSQAAAAVAADQKIILGVCWKCGEDFVRSTFQSLQAIGALSRVAYLYPTDEPPKGSDDLVRSYVPMLRRVASEFSELNDVKVAVIFGNEGGEVAKDMWDVVGHDNYPNIPVVTPLANQTVWIVPGSFDGYRADPNEAYRIANTHPEVSGIIVFIYNWPPDGTKHNTVVSNGTKEAWCELGKKITQKIGPC